jgi:hypothetical protein
MSIRDKHKKKAGKLLENKKQLPGKSISRQLLQIFL